MSTNFYWKLPFPDEVTLPTGARYRYDSTTDDPEIHIGKSFMRTFSWAQQPALVRAACEENMDKVVFISEYHQPFTGREFLDYIKGSEYRTDHIGTMFS